jgi:hypothetical protein
MPEEKRAHRTEHLNDPGHVLAHLDAVQAAQAATAKPAEQVITSHLTTGRHLTPFNLSCRVRNDGGELAELWNAVVARWNDLLGKAKAAAQSWQQHEDFENLKARHEEFSTRLARTKVDDWEINAAVHYNEWAALHKADFHPVFDAFKDLIACFTCSHCTALLYVAPPRGAAESIRRDCHRKSINLKKKQ